MLLRGITMADLNDWIDGLFNFMLAEYFVVGGVQFSLWDVFCGGVVLSITGYAMGKLILFVKDRR